MQLEEESPAPVSTMPYPPLHTDKKFVILSDWDGTITNRDTNDFMTDTLGFGPEKRRQGNLEILSGRDTFRDGFRKMLASIHANGHTFQECRDAMKKNIGLDDGFKEFYEWVRENDLPFLILSSGMAPFIRAVLSNLVGEEEANKIDIVANDAIIYPDGRWEIKFRHPTSGYGHDKSQAILPYKNLPNPPTIFFFGDGVSDMSAARHADVLFVKVKPGADNDLHAFCAREGIPHILFENFHQALPIVKRVVNGELTVRQALALGKA